MTHTKSIDKTIFMIIGGLFLVALVAIWVMNLHKVESTELQGQVAPDFTLTLFEQYGTEPIRLSDLRGQVVVINFWASWCVECYKEADLLQKVSVEYQTKGVVFIGIDHLDTDKPALAYLAQYGITYPNGVDLGDKISQAYAITGVPETFFIDKEGNIAHVQIGPIEETTLYDLLDKLIAQSAKAGT